MIGKGGIGGRREAGVGTRPPAPRTHGVRGPAGRLPDTGASRRGARPGRSGSPWKAAFFALTAAAIVVGAIWALLGSSLLVVRSVAVTGIHLVPRAQVLRAAGIRPGTPLVRIDTAGVARRVERINQVQSAQVSRHWPDAVVITIQERTPALAVASGGGFALVDKFGVVVSRVARRPRGMVVLASAPSSSALTSLRGSPAVRAAVTVLQQLPARIRDLVRAVAAPSASTVTLDLRGGITVLWGGADRPAAKAAELAILMRTRATYYDLSDPGTAVTGRGGRVGGQGRGSGGQGRG
jgi:cell division protein FtsQ